MKTQREYKQDPSPRLTAFISALALCSLLAACGGGGGSSNNSNTDASATTSSVSSAYDGTYIEVCDAHTDYSVQATLTLSNGNAHIQSAYFSNTQCSGQPAATVIFPQTVLTFLDPVSISGIQGQKVSSVTAGGLVTYTGVAYDNHSGRVVIPVGASGDWVDSSIAAGTDKDLIAVKDGKLYTGDFNASKDQAGYPSAFDLIHYFIKQ
ncbi:MAG: hypothetical protein QM749_08070 [Aquabacterium sp.]